MYEENTNQATDKPNETEIKFHILRFAIAADWHSKSAKEV